MKGQTAENQPIVCSVTNSQRLSKNITSQKKQQVKRAIMDMGMNMTGTNCNDTTLDKVSLFNCLLESHGN